MFKKYNTAKCLLFLVEGQQRERVRGESARESERDRVRERERERERENGRTECHGTKKKSNVFAV